jgi:hypothetical protein
LIVPALLGFPESPGDTVGPPLSNREAGGVTTPVLLFGGVEPVPMLMFLAASDAPSKQAFRLPSHFVRHRPYSWLPAAELMSMPAHPPKQFVAASSHCFTVAADAEFAAATVAAARSRLIGRDRRTIETSIGEAMPAEDARPTFSAGAHIAVRFALEMDATPPGRHVEACMTESRTFFASAPLAS